MRPALALWCTMTLAACGGSVNDLAEGTAGSAPAGAAGSPIRVVDAGLGDAGSAPLDSSGAAGSLPTEPGAGWGGDAGAPGDADAEAGAPPSLAGAPGIVRPTVITRTVVDAPLLPRGFLSGTQYRADTDSSSVYTVDAIFETTRGQWDGCTQVRLGECWYYDCPPGSAPFLPSVPLQDAGRVSLSTNRQPVTQVDVGLLYDFWYEANATGGLWAASGEKLTFAATGSTVPAFSFDVASPPTVALTSLNGESAPTRIARSDGAALRWSSSGSGIAYFSLYGFYERKFAAICEFDARANAGELPAVLLQELESGPDYRVIFRGTSRAHASVEGWELDASLAGYGGPASPYDPPILELR
ncbi:MAG: hypothetical protein ABW061_29245 [Polyangiaceae bacterium]